MLKWDDVRRIYVQLAAPALQALGFGQPGRTMFRRRGPFIDVVDFSCHRRGTAKLSLGCGLRKFVKNSPKPWDCQFSSQSISPWPTGALDYRETAEQQEKVMLLITPLLISEVERWFGLLPNLSTALAAANRNEVTHRDCVGYFHPGCEFHVQLVDQLQMLIESEG